MPGLIRLDPTQMRLNRRRFATLAAASVASVALGDVAVAQSTTAATPSVTPTGANDAVTMLTDAATAMSKLKTFHFEMTTPAGSASIMQGLELKGITGDVRRPVDFKTVIKASIPFGTIDITVIGLNGEIWIQDPTSKSGQWISLTKESGMDPGVITTFVNPDVLILRAVSFVHDAKITGHEKVGGAKTTRVEGQVNLDSLSKMVASNSENAPTGLASGPLPVIVWVDDDKRIREIELDGQILTTESADVVHDITFSDFDKPVEIKAPV